QSHRRAVAPRGDAARAREDPRRERAAHARHRAGLGGAGAAVTAPGNGSRAPWRVRARNELEIALGGVQLRALERTISLAAGVRGGRTPDGVAYFARPARRGLPVVGVHGFGGDKETWLFMATLVARSRGVVGIDLPGHGRSDDVPESQASVR